MIRIGLGISTYNRQHSLKNLINSIRKYTTNIPYDLFCAVDGSTDGTVDMLMKEGVEFTYGQNIGPHRNKNRIFRRFSDYNFIFLIEDDMEIIRSGWIELYILASNLFNIPHFTYATQKDQDYKELRVASMGRTKISWIDTYNTRMLFYTRRAIEKVGGIDERFKSYGLGTYEQFLRLIGCGLVPKNTGVPVLIDAKYYIKANINKPELITPEEKLILYKNDEILLKKLIAESFSTNHYYRKL